MKDQILRIYWREYILNKLILQIWGNGRGLIIKKDGKESFS
jgi:hypothetical protein